MDYTTHYSEQSFLSKIKKYGRTAGYQIVYHALQLFYALKKKDTPLAAKATIVAGLGYFILPIDTIPDFLIGMGYGDDLGVLLGIVTACSMYIDDGCREKAKAKAEEMFGAGRAASRTIDANAV